MINKEAERIIDEFDAAMFSSDVFHDLETLIELRNYLNRWQRRSDEIEVFICAPDK